MQMNSLCFGLDTSNYTTSAAVFDGETGRNASRILDVPKGALGLRQSDALFFHVRRLPEIVESLLEGGDLRDIAAVAASTRPRAVEGSYMPCFLAGESQGRNIARALGVPFYAFSHQEGHLAAAAWSSGHIEMLGEPFLAWHLSGGTTELLYVEPEGKSIRASAIGGTSDISAGQLIDRTGVRLGLRFPAGKSVDRLAAAGKSVSGFKVKVEGMRFSLSGMENKMTEMAGGGRPPEDVSRFVLETIARAVRAATDEAVGKYGKLPVLMSGGVSSNSLLRGRMPDARFAAPEFSADNAMGIAILARRSAD
jgi:N6-L-threonylcarbamoyladenine synthase